MPGGLGVRFAGMAGLSVGRGADDLAVEPLQALALIAKAARQKLEQLRVARPPAIEAEVARAVDDADTEVVVPDAIDDHAKEKRVVAAGDPVSELLAAGGFGCVWRQAEVGGEA